MTRFSTALLNCRSGGDDTGLPTGFHVAAHRSGTADLCLDQIAANQSRFTA